MSHYETICLTCGAVQGDHSAFACRACGGLLGFRYDYEDVRWDDTYAGSMWRFWRLLPVEAQPHVMTLGEGATPLLRSRTYAQARLFLKDETRNPTGSHKDRPLSLAVHHAQRVGASTSFVVSTGSTGISNAALAACAGLRSVVIMTQGTPAARVYPMYALGSTVIEVQGAVDDVIDQVIRLARSHGLYLSSTSRGSNPYQGEANKTIAYEIVEQLGAAPDWVIVPVGGGGTLSGIWRGFNDLAALGRIERLPRMVGVVPRHYNALEVALERGLTRWQDVLALPYHDAPPSILVKLAHSYPPDGMDAIDAIRASDGLCISIDDETALDAQMRFARGEGLYIEPSTGVVPAAVDRLLAEGQIHPDETTVALVCGSGFRETFASMDLRPLQKQTVSSHELADTLMHLAR